MEKHAPFKFDAEGKRLLTSRYQIFRAFFRTFLNSSPDDVCDDTIEMLFNYIIIRRGFLRQIYESTLYRTESEIMS